MKPRWEKKKLRDLCRLISGQHIDSKDYNIESRGFGYLTGPSDFGTIHPTVSKWTEFPKVKAIRGDILLTVKGSGVGKINLLDKDDVVISRQLMAIRVTGAEPLFIYAFLGSVFSHFQELSTGAAIPGISREQVLGLEVFLPPLSEQKHIVAILEDAFERIDTAISNTEKNLANTRELLDSYLNEALTKHNEQWPKKKLGDVCHRITVGHVGSMASRYKANGIPFLRSQNVKPFEIDLNDVKFIDNAFHCSLSKSSLSPGDVAIVRTGYPGTAAVIPETLLVANCSDLVIAKPKNFLSPHYLALFFNSFYGKKIVGLNLVGAAQKHFNITAAKAVEIPIPSIKEQHRVVERAMGFKTETESMRASFKRRILILVELKQSLLQKAFSGELTVGMH